MIKRLIHCNNQKALVLDEALLSILNINDTTDLKLSIDGKSLVITPVEGTTAENTELAEMSDEEATLYYYSNIGCHNTQPEFLKLSPEQQAQAKEELMAVMKKYDETYNYTQEMLKVIGSESYKKGIADLGRQAALKKLSTKELQVAAGKLFQELLPNVPLDAMEEEMKVIRAKYQINC